MTKLLTIPEAAELLAVSETTVSREIGRGNLRATRIGRQVRISQQDLDDYLERNQVVQQAKAKRLEGWAG